MKTILKDQNNMSSEQRLFKKQDKQTGIESQIKIDQKMR
jgi:hypothetical protein